MNKIYWTLLILLCSASFASCINDDDDDEIDYTWKDNQTSIYNNISTLTDDSGNNIYTALQSESGNGYVYWKTSDFITNRMTGDFSQNQPTVYPTTRASLVKPSALTDSVVVRYEGWFYDNDGEFIRFDGTETISNSKPPYIGTNNNVTPSGFSVSSVIDGFRTTLMDMVVNEERITCFPAVMGYGSVATSSNSVTIPAYTTLFFDIKLLKIYSGDGTLIVDGTATE